MERKKIEEAVGKFITGYPFLRVYGEPNYVNGTSGDIKFVSIVGWRYGTPITVYLVPSENLELFCDPYTETYRDRQYKQERPNSFFHIPYRITNFPEHLYQLKKTLCVENNVDILIYERPVGDHIILIEKFQGPAMECVQEISEFAVLYWNSQSLFGQMSSEFKVADYFVRRFQRWKNYVKNNPSRRLVGYRDFVDPDYLDKILLNFLMNLPEELLESRMEMTWNLLGTTDTVVVEGSEPVDSKYYLQNVRCEPRPIGFGPAACIWNIILYGYNKLPEAILKDVIIYEEVFAHHSPLLLNNYTLYHAGFRANLFERLYAALMIDLPYCRSPYNKPGPENDPTNIHAILKTAENILHVMKHYFEV